MSPFDLLKAPATRDTSASLGLSLTNFNANYSHVPTGGIVFVGSAAIVSSLNYLFNPSGGIIFSGLAATEVSSAQASAGSEWRRFIHIRRGR